MDGREMREQVLAVLKHVAPDAETEAIDPAASFRDQFGIDSIDFLNFVVGLEEALGVRIGEADYPWLSSLDGCIAYLAEHAGSRSTAPSI